MFLDTDNKRKIISVKSCLKLFVNQNRKRTNMIHMNYIPYMFHMFHSNVIFITHIWLFNIYKF